MRSVTQVLVLWTLIDYIACSQFSGHVVYRGCFSVSTRLRLSDARHLINPFTAETCFELCFGLGDTFAGLDSINSTCYCHHDLTAQITDPDASLCFKCKENNTLFCGGVSKLSLYEIDADISAVNSLVDPKEIESRFDETPLILLAGKGGIYSYNSSSHSLQTILDVGGHTVEAIDYHLGRKEGFAIWDGSIYRFPLLEDNPITEESVDLQHVWDVDRCFTFAVDWVHDKIYFPDCHYHHIYVLSMPSLYTVHNHYTSDILVPTLPEGAWALDMAVDPYKGLLFWTTGAALWSVRLDGRGLSKVIPQFPINRVAALSIDLPAQRVYFSGEDRTDKNTSLLFFTSYTGSVSHPLQFHEYEGGKHVLHFGIFNYHVYFIKSFDHNASVVMSSKLEYLVVPSLIVSGKDAKQFSLIKLIHPRLQAPGKEDACTHRGCSNLCLLEADLPRCYCPRYHDLEEDNATCTFYGADDTDEPLVVRVAFGLMMVLFVLLGAAVLMALCDKLWSQLHPAVVRLSLPGAAKRSFTGRPRPDGENLI